MKLQVGESRAGWKVEQYLLPGMIRRHHSAEMLVWEGVM
jgi:hypothetical protein